MKLLLRKRLHKRSKIIELEIEEGVKIGKRCRNYPPENHDLDVTYEAITNTVLHYIKLGMSPLRELRREHEANKLKNRKPPPPAIEIFRQAQEAKWKKTLYWDRKRRL